MLIDLSGVFQSESGNIHLSYTPGFTSVRYRGQDFSVSEKSPVALDCVYEQDGRARVQAGGYVVLDLFCDRCLKPVAERVDFEIDRTVYAPGFVPQDEDGDSVEIMDGYQLNADRLIFNEVLINWPEKVLCKADCKGLCRVCGRDLNLGDCGCDDFVPDPRMAVIKDIMNADKEV